MCSQGTVYIHYVWPPPLPLSSTLSASAPDPGQGAVPTMCGPTLSSADWLLTEAINAGRIGISLPGNAAAGALCESNLK